MWNRQIRIIAIVVSFLMISSCGYRLTPVGGVVPEGTKTIAIPVVLNNTAEPYVDIMLTQAVVDEFLTDGRLKIADLEEADLILRCKIMRFYLTSVAYSTNTYVQTYNVNVIISYSLEDTKTRKMLLPETSLNTAFISSYSVFLGDITATKTAKETAIANASRDIASRLRSRVLEGF